MIKVILTLMLFSISAFANEPAELKIYEDTEQVQTVRENYKTIRMVFSREGIYPSLDLEIFTKNGEGYPLVVHSSVNIVPGTEEISSSNVTNIKLTLTELTFDYKGKQCVFKVDINAQGMSSKDAVCK